VKGLLNDPNWFKFVEIKGNCMSCTRFMIVRGGLCSTCRYRAFSFAGTCKRCSFVSNDIFKLNQEGHCCSCHTHLQKLKKQGKEATEFNPKLARRYAIRDNKPQRIIAFSSFSRPTRLPDTLRLIRGIMCEDSVGDQTVTNWFKKQFLQPRDSIDKFLDIDNVSDYSIDCLVVCEFLSIPRPTVEQATNRLKDLFGVNFVNQERAQKVYDNINQVRKELKRIAIEQTAEKSAAKKKLATEQTPENSATKKKLAIEQTPAKKKQDSSSAKKPKLDDDVIFD